MAYPGEVKVCLQCSVISIGPFTDITDTSPLIQVSIMDIIKLVMMKSIYRSHCQSMRCFFMELAHKSLKAF